jgi:hypothetical protein
MHPAPARSRTLRESAPEFQRLGRAGAARARVDTAQAQLARVLATHAHAKGQPSRGDLGDRGELTRDGGGMAQRE